MQFNEIIAILQNLTNTKISQELLGKSLGVGRSAINQRIKANSSLSLPELKKIEKYFNVPEDRDLRAMKGNGYVWNISDLKIYDKPRELSEFSRPCSYSGLCFSCKRTSFKKDGNLLCNTKITRPPQSWMHVEDLGEEK